jgi:hypothetical protein
MDEGDLLAFEVSDEALEIAAGKAKAGISCELNDLQNGN